jgi:hypothetical protein
MSLASLAPVADDRTLSVTLLLCNLDTRPRGLDLAISTDKVGKRNVNMPEKGLGAVRLSSKRGNAQQRLSSAYCPNAAKGNLPT